MIKILSLLAINIVGMQYDQNKDKKTQYGEEFLKKTFDAKSWFQDYNQKRIVAYLNILSYSYSKIARAINYEDLESFHKFNNISKKC